MAFHLHLNEGKVRVFDKITLTSSHVFEGRPYCNRLTSTIDNINMSEPPVIITLYCKFLQINSVRNTSASLMVVIKL